MNTPSLPGVNPGARVRRTVAGLALVAVATLLSACHKEPSAAEASASLKAELAEVAQSNEVVKVAISASTTEDFAGSVIALEAAKTVPGLSAGQLATMEQARQAFTANLVRRADAGDAAAKAQLAAIERSRSQ